MSKGSGRRRITPSDGLQYDEETMMTNIEERGAAHYQSGSKELRLGLRTNAPPTDQNRGRRWAGKGRKDDNRNWKNHGRGKQYEHNALAKEKMEHHTPISESLAARLRQRSIAILLYEARWRQARRQHYDRRARYWDEQYRSLSSSFRHPPQSEQKYRIGFAVFEKKVQNLLDSIRWGLIDAFGNHAY